MTTSQAGGWGGVLCDKSIYTLPCFICSHGLCSRLPIQACLPAKPSVTKKKFPQPEVGLELRGAEVEKETREG